MRNFRGFLFMLKRSCICCFIIYATVPLKDFVKIGRTHCLQSTFWLLLQNKIIMPDNCTFAIKFFQSHFLTFIFNLIFLILANICVGHMVGLLLAHRSVPSMKKMVKKFSFFVYFCALLLHLGLFLFFILFAKTTPLFSCHRICPDEGNSVNGNFRGIFPVQ